MKKLMRSGWFSVILLLGLSVVILEVDYLIPMSKTMHNLFLAGGIILLLVTGATYMYEHARLNNDPDAWWKDDDWTHWGGI